MAIHDINLIKEALLVSSAGWARVGLTAPNSEMRERAAEDLARTISATLDPPPVADRDQLPLPL